MLAHGTSLRIKIPAKPVGPFEVGPACCQVRAMHGKEVFVLHVLDTRIAQTVVVDEFGDGRGKAIFVGAPQ